MTNRTGASPGRTRRPSVRRTSLVRALGGTPRGSSSPGWPPRSTSPEGAAPCGAPDRSRFPAPAHSRSASRGDLKLPLLSFLSLYLTSRRPSGWTAKALVAYLPRVTKQGRVFGSGSAEGRRERAFGFAPFYLAGPPGL